LVAACIAVVHTFPHARGSILSSRSLNFSQGLLKRLLDRIAVPSH
jgi:hypothetical protein